MSPALLRFAYAAIHRDGSRVTGEIPAATAEEAYERLSAGGLLPLDVVAFGRPARRRRLTAADLGLGLRLLADVLDSGVPMQRALSLFGDLAPGNWQSALPQIRGAIREGRSLSGALTECSIEFPAVVLGMVRAGESGQGLAKALRRAAEHSEATASIHNAVRGALAYPAFVAGAGALTLMVMVGVVIPRFAVILADLGQQLPSSTRVVLEVADISRLAMFPLVAITGIGATLLLRFRRTDAGAAIVDAFLLRLPLVGETRRASATARVTATLSALLESGVSFQPALRLAAQASGDAHIATQLYAVGDRIRSGESISSALRRHRALTTTAMRLVDAGERTGRLIPLLEHAARLEQDRATRTIQTAVRFLEPALILAFAVVVGGVAVALLQAVYAVRPG